ncbi:hypothetical protein LMH66_19230 [Shewanella sp. 10N.7]|uniref:hypothetical protein n=1 Tax=Shewanella sp. 10N.7 TaxID=2885093 RepID=UPI001E5BC98D|nr:hypothetical protein [Shewanella sp. 10N.7]MCC4834780.1 hypothetical protein [Shewanella sp. 10N.7]
MSADDIKSTFRKYKLISTGSLLVFLLLAIFINKYLIDNSIQRHYDLGLPYAAADTGFTWMAIIMGLFTVLYLCFYSFEKILLKLLIKPNIESE